MRTFKYVCVSRVCTCVYVCMLQVCVRSFTGFPGRGCRSPPLRGATEGSTPTTAAGLPFHSLPAPSHAASLRDKQQEFFIGGSRELDDVTYLERGVLGGGSGPSAPDLKRAAELRVAAEKARPQGPAGAGGGAQDAATHMYTNPLAEEAEGEGAATKHVLNKYGFQTESSGTLKVGGCVRVAPCAPVHVRMQVCFFFGVSVGF